MNVGELKQWLQDNAVPDEANVCILSDASPCCENIWGVYLTKDANDDPIWEFEDYQYYYDEERLAQYDKLEHIVAICLHGDLL